jgi:DNA mismatch repair protein MLH3
LAQTAEELVANSIDAGARTITLRVNLQKYWLEVADDGRGINEEDLPLVGNRYHTSKCHRLTELNGAVTSYGFRGEALSSIRDVGVVKIVTRQAATTAATTDAVGGVGGGGGARSSVVSGITRTAMLDGKSAKVGVAAIERVSQGTTVTVADLFKNMPVRRQCISAGDVEDTRRRVETIALAHPEIAFAVYNANTGQQLLRVRGVWECGGWECGVRSGQGEVSCVCT